MALALPTWQKLFVGLADSLHLNLQSFDQYISRRLMPAESATFWPSPAPFADYLMSACPGTDSGPRTAKHVEKSGRISS